MVYPSWQYLQMIHQENPGQRNLLHFKYIGTIRRGIRIIQIIDTENRPDYSSRGFRDWSWNFRDRGNGCSGYAFEKYKMNNKKNNSDCVRLSDPLEEDLILYISTNLTFGVRFIGEIHFENHHICPWFVFRSGRERVQIIWRLDKNCNVIMGGFVMTYILSSVLCWQLV